MATLTLSFKGNTLKSYSFADGSITVGRDPDCAIFVDSLALEPQHARIELAGETATVFDLTDNNGVRVNGIATQKQALNEGDEIQVGKHTLEYSAKTGIIEPPPAPPAPAPTIESDEPAPAAEPDAVETKQIGWLQVMSGKQFGKSMPLKQGITRIGVPGKQTAAIAHRSGGYFLSPLEGDTPPTVNGQPVSEGSYELKEGNTIAIAGITLQFYLEDE